MAASKLEINFRRLLERCEAMAEEIQDNKENVNWRLDKVGSIDVQVTFWRTFPFHWNLSQIYGIDNFGIDSYKEILC